MRQFQGVWFPDAETHMTDWMRTSGQLVDGRGTYQFKKWMACIPHIKQWRTAVDVGAHVGLWSMQMVKRFQCVHAFEPVGDFRDCYALNVSGVVTLNKCALGSVRGRVRMRINPEDTGGTHVDPVAEDGNIELRTLDSFSLDGVDFIKIDCEGFESQVIDGARETIKRNKPCIIVEQKQHIMSRNYGINGTPAVDMLRGMGAVVRKEISGDWILSWD